MYNTDFNAKVRESTYWKLRLFVSRMVLATLCRYEVERESLLTQEQPISPLLKLQISDSFAAPIIPSEPFS
jgi:hypothetical protein